jgi:3-phenylpropionate/trans-cinnamate dioxygenase ferredoxin reductase component
MTTFAIVGAGLAGATAAQTLRDEGFEGEVVLLGDEAHRPYERPPLSKEYLQGKSPRDKVFVHPEGWYAEHDVDLRLGVTATSVDLLARRVLTSDGASVQYDSLLIATGSTPRRLALPGSDLDGVLYLRRLDDSDRIRAAFVGTPRVVVVGAGWIGLETAAAARVAGLSVTVLEHAGAPLERILGSRMSAVFSQLHRDNGVDLRCGVTISELTGTSGRVTGVRLGDGTEIEADLVLVGVGISPETSLADTAGLAIGNGITVDEHLRTSDPDVYAAGDVADAFHPLLGHRLRVEHWANARRQGAVAARSMLGQDAVYARLPYFFSDQYDLGMEYTGYVDPAGVDDVVVRGDLQGRRFVAFWLGDGRVRAGMSVNIWDATEAVEELITTGRRVDAALLADPDVPLPTG